MINNNKNNKAFSIVMATYTGIDTISKTLESILNQANFNNNFELIVIIDGPNQTLWQKINAYKQKFSKYGIDFKIRQFKKNRGRFEARLAGVKIAKNNQILIVDDRILLANNFIKTLQSFDDKIVIAHVKELPNNSRNFISQTLFLIRKKIYGYRANGAFDYYISSSNFEHSPKGTTSLWIDKKIFLKACRAVKSKNSKLNKYINEDTRILRIIVDWGYKILKTQKFVVYYQPRILFFDSIKHLYDRGPRFVDYYQKPGTRFFPVLISIYFVSLLILFIAIFWPSWLYLTFFLILTATVLTAVLISHNLREFISSVLGLIFIGLAFSLGVWKGTILKIREAVFNK